MKNEKELKSKWTYP